MRRPYVLLSVGLVIAAEAVGGLVVHETKNLFLVVPIVVISVAALVWLLEFGVEAGVERWNWVASRFGARLTSGATVHGYWFTTIYGREPDGSLTFLGGSVVKITATTTGFNLEGDAYVKPDWRREPWGGHGLPFGDDGILYGYRGTAGQDKDHGYGLDNFFSGGKPQSLNGDFYGAGLRQYNFREVTGARCPAKLVTKAFRTDEDERRRCLLDHLEAQGLHR